MLILIINQNEKNTIDSSDISAAINAIIFHDMEFAEQVRFNSSRFARARYLAENPIRDDNVDNEHLPIYGRSTDEPR